MENSKMNQEIKTEKKPEGNKSGKLLFRFLGAAIRFLTRLIWGFTLDEDPRIKEWKASGKAFVILSGHPAEMDAVVLLAAVYPRYARFVVGAQQLYRGWQGWLLRQFDVIPRKQFISDITSVKEMIKTIRDGQILGMMPEGRVSLDGTPSPIDESTGKLLKKLNCPVAILIPEGTYWIKPPYDHGAFIRGKMKGTLKVFLEEGEAAQYTAEELTEKLNKEMYYNEAEALRGTGRKYSKRKGVLMPGISNLLYLCPECGSLYTIYDNGTHIGCSKCGMKIGLSRKMLFEPEKEGLPDCVPQWNDLQLEYEREFWKDPDARLESQVTEFTAVLGLDAEFKNPRKGRLVLDRSGLRYIGDDDEFFVPLAQLPGFSADYMYGCIACYENDLVRRFALDDIRKVPRYVNSLMILRGCK